MKSWTKEDEENIVVFLKNGFTYNEIGKKLNKSPNSIRTKLFRLGYKYNDLQEFYVIKNCLNCNKEFISKRFEERKFCNHICSAKYNSTGRIMSEETKNKIRNSLLNNSNVKIKERNDCITCGKKVKRLQNKYCSRECVIKSEEVKDKIRQKAIERFKNFPEQHPNIRCAKIRETYPEKFFKEFLILNNLKENIDFFTQYRIDKYFIDFYFPNIKLCVEIDGERWHNKDNKKEILRESIIKMNYNLIRFDVKPLLKKEYEISVLEIINKNKIASVAQR